MLRGTIVESIPGRSVTIQLVTGELRVVPYNETFYAGPDQTVTSRPMPTTGTANEEPGVELRRRSMAAVGVGIGALSLVPVSLAVAIFGWAEQKRCEQDTSMAGYEVRPDGRIIKECGGEVIAGGVLGTLVLAPLGIILIVHGAKKVPVERRTGVSLVPWGATANGAGGTLRVTF